MHSFRGETQWNKRELLRLSASKPATELAKPLFKSIHRCLALERCFRTRPSEIVDGSALGKPNEQIHIAERKTEKLETDCRHSRGCRQVNQPRLEQAADTTTRQSHWSESCKSKRYGSDSRVQLARHLSWRRVASSSLDSLRVALVSLRATPRVSSARNRLDSVRAPTATSSRTGGCQLAEEGARLCFARCYSWRACALPVPHCSWVRGARGNWTAQAQALASRRIFQYSIINNSLVWVKSNSRLQLYSYIRSRNLWWARKQTT